MSDIDKIIKKLKITIDEYPDKTGQHCNRLRDIVSSLYYKNTEIKAKAKRIAELEQDKNILDWIEINKPSFMFLKNQIVMWWNKEDYCVGKTIRELINKGGKMKEEITGRLENWCFDGRIIWGYLYEDIRLRFVDGAQIHTSIVMTKPPFKQGDIVETLNSRYLLGEERK